MEIILKGKGNEETGGRRYIAQDCTGCQGYGNLVTAITVPRCPLLGRPLWTMDSGVTPHSYTVYLVPL